MKSTFIAMLLLAATLAPAAVGEKLEALAEQYQRAGEPIEPHDFVAKGVPESENAAIELAQAALAFDRESPSWKEYESIERLSHPLNENQVMLLQRIVLENLQTIEHIDAAMRRQRVDWKIEMKSPTFETLLRHLGGQRQLSNLLQADAWLMAHDGADAQVLRDVQRIMFIAWATDHDGFLVGHLVSLAQMSQAINVLEMSVPRLKIAPAPAAPPDVIKELIATLLQDNRATLRKALAAERMSQLDIARHIISGKLTPKKLGQLAGDRGAFAIPKEMAERDGVLLMTHTTQVMGAVDESVDWPSYLARRPPPPREIEDNRKNHLLAGLLLPSFDRSVLAHYRSTADRRLAAVALAARLYAAANDGTLPATLDALAPAYLPAVPLDPMSSAQPLRYDRQRAVVYSVGEDGKDDGGDVTPTPGHKRPGRWQGKDAVIRLTLGDGGK